MRWLEKYQSIPFVEDGNDFSGCNCWGMIKLIFWNEAGIYVPDYPGTPAKFTDKVHKLIKSDSAIRPWQCTIDIGEELPFDVVVMRGLIRDKKKSFSGPVHVGIVPVRGFIFHTEKGKGPMCVPTTHTSVKKRIVSIHRHERLT